MTLQELRYLVALADTGQFISAAQACHVGQPTLSMQLKKLENFLGVTLFERSSHGVVPTPVGREIIEHARVAIEVVEQIRELAHQSHDPMDGSLRLGVIPTLGPYFIPRLLPVLRSSFPKFHLHPREGQTAELLEGLRQHRYDALLLSLPVAARDVETLPLFHEPLMVAMPAGHALGERPHVSREELACQQVLQLEEGHCLRKLALDVCGAPMLLDDEDELKAGSIETLRQMVAAGLGCALLPSLAVSRGMGTAHSGALQVRPLAPPVPGRSLGLVWRQHCPRAETMSTLARFIQANLPDAVEAIPRDGDAARHAGADAGVTGLPFHFHPAANAAAPCVTGAS